MPRSRRGTSETTSFVHCPRVSPQFLAEKSAPEKGLHLIRGDVSTGSIPAFAPSLPFELRLGKCRRRCNSTRRMQFRELKIVPRPSSALSANLLAALLPDYRRLRRGVWAFLCQMSLAARRLRRHRLPRRSTHSLCGPAGGLSLNRHYVRARSHQLSSERTCR